MNSWDDLVSKLKEKNAMVDKALVSADEHLSEYIPVSPFYRSIRKFYFQPPSLGYVPRQYKVASCAKIVFRDRTDIKSYHDIQADFIRRAKALGANALIKVKCSGGQMIATPAFLIEPAGKDDDYRSKISYFERRLVGKVSDPVIVSFERRRMIKLEKEVSYWRGHNDGYYLNHSTRGKFPPNERDP